MATGLLQVGGAAAAEVEQGIGIARAVDVQITRAHLAPLGHVFGAVVEPQVYLGAFVDDIAGVVEHGAGALSSGDVEHRRFIHDFALVELGIADTEVHRGIQDDVVLCLRGGEHEVLGVEKVGIPHFQIRNHLPVSRAAECVVHILVGIPV